MIPKCRAFLRAEAGEVSESLWLSLLRIWKLQIGSPSMAVLLLPLSTALWQLRLLQCSETAQRFWPALKMDQPSPCNQRKPSNRAKVAHKGQKWCAQGPRTETMAPAKNGELMGICLCHTETKAPESSSCRHLKLNLPTRRSVSPKLPAQRLLKPHQP